MHRTLNTNCRLIAREIALNLEAIEYTDTAYEKVPEIFALHVKNVRDRDDRYEIFRLLDEQPGLFPNYLDGHWHRILRQCRNRPDPYGKRLFHFINEGV